MQVNIMLKITQTMGSDFANHFIPLTHLFQKIFFFNFNLSTLIIKTFSYRVTKIVHVNIKGKTNASIIMGR